MSSFDNHQHIEEVMADASDAERQELNEWIHGLDSESIADEVDPSGGCEVDEADFEDDGQPSECDEWQDFYGGEDWEPDYYDEP